MVGLVWEVWFGRFGLVGLVWEVWFGRFGLVSLIPSYRVNSLSPALTAVTAVASFATHFITTSKSF